MKFETDKFPEGLFKEPEEILGGEGCQEGEEGGVADKVLGGEGEGAGGEGGEGHPRRQGEAPAAESPPPHVSRLKRVAEAAPEVQ